MDQSEGLFCWRYGSSLSMLQGAILRAEVVEMIEEWHTLVRVGLCPLPRLGLGCVTETLRAGSCHQIVVDFLLLKA